MSAYELAKDAARLAGTATLSKDVVDLLHAKLSLLADQVALLEKENANLKAENKNLHAELQHIKPVGFMENMGVFWKRAKTGFEEIPYCRECPTHPIMYPMHGPNIWVCGVGEHSAPFDVKPPSL